MAEKEFPATRRQIIERHPLLDYARARGWALRKDGPRYRCLCPLHKEDSPSFVIGPDLNCWKCFGCTEAGSVIDLHAKLNNMTVGQAMRDLWPTDQQEAPLRMPRYFSTPKPAEPAEDSYDPFEDDVDVEHAPRVESSTQTDDLQTERVSGVQDESSPGTTDVREMSRGVHAGFSKDAQNADGSAKKHNARSYARVYLARGKLVKRPCENCGNEQVEMHHADHSKPLEVTWLCRKCHLLVHR